MSPAGGRSARALKVVGSADGARRRGTACNSQIYSDEPIQTASKIKQTARPGHGRQPVEGPINDTVTSHGLDSTNTDSSQDHLTRVEAGLLTGQTLERSAHSTVDVSVQYMGAARKHDEICCALTAAWPSQHDIDLICTLPVGVSAHLVHAIYTPYSESTEHDATRPREMLQLPLPGSHPVLIARKLLMIGVYLQSVLPSSVQNLADLGVSLRNTMSHVVETAIRLVTTNEDLIISVEGIECIIIEAMYQNYAGKLHRAWMAVRRAITVAQMMALHQGLNSLSLKFIEANKRAVFDVDRMCFCLVNMDCYLSLMLGLPRTSVRARFADPKALKACQPIERMQRIHCSIAERILQRKATDLSETQDIDFLLQKVAAEMSPQWWLIPNLSASISCEGDAFHETIRLIEQLTHYHLLIRLHLPYMLRSTSDLRRDHSKITAINVSRESLTRFITLRTSNPAHYYCRGIDFLAFISTTVLCLAHIDSRSLQQESSQGSNPGAVFNFLAHSRPSDRDLMDRTLYIIESMTRGRTDPIASRIARILHDLLDIEADAASGAIYAIKSSKGDEEELEYDSKLFNGGKVLHIQIPSFGSINFERRATSKSCPIPSSISVNTQVSDKLGVHNNQSTTCQTNDHLNSYIAQTEGLQLDPLTSSQKPPSQSNGISGFSSATLQEDQFFFPIGGADAEEDDLTLQGVDVALFDSLFC